MLWVHAPFTSIRLGSGAWLDVHGVAAGQPQRLAHQTPACPWAHAAARTCILMLVMAPQREKKKLWSDASSTPAASTPEPGGYNRIHEFGLGKCLARGRGEENKL